MARYVNLDNPKIFKTGRDKWGNVLYAIPPDTPCEDVRPAIHGHWIDMTPINEKTGIRLYHLKCSECGKMEFFASNFCSKCGAIMDKPWEVENDNS